MTQPLDRLTEALRDRYVLERELGAGGMATVYLARDLRHDRYVALKVLRPELAAVVGAERFLHEIKTTAHLQHPHILPLHDSGEADGSVFYVMPYVEGETLRDRLRREKQLPVEDTVRIASEVASALDYAHRHGVVHRDIKPENILLYEGQALVADFGIALAVSRTDGGTRMTESGMSLGTPHYMSPEQAMGEREITGRSDIYALGCVTYEMLTGDPPFTGSTAQAIVAQMLTERPRGIAAQRRTVTPAMEAAVFRALEKLPADRFASAVEFAEALAGEGAATVARSAPGSTPARRRVRSTAMVGLALALGTAFGMWLPRPVARPGAASGGVARTLDLVLPDSLPFAFLGPAPLGVEQRALDVSPDGLQLVYVSPTASDTTLVVRDLVHGGSRVLAGTEGAFSPTFSPDGRSIAFFSGTVLKKVPAAGGTPQALATVDEPWGSVWLDSSRIFVAGRQGEKPMLVDAFSGWTDSIPGGPRRAGSITPDRSGMVYSYQHLLRYFDFATRSEWVLTSGGRVPVDSVVVADAIFGFGPTLLPSGYLLYVQQGGAGTLLAVPVEPGTLRPTGSPVQVSANVRFNSQGTAQYATSEDGAVVMASTPGSGRTALVVRSASGSIASLGLPPADYGTFEISPDGRRVAIAIWPVKGLPDLWVRDLARGTSERIVQATIRGPVWLSSRKGPAALDTTREGPLVTQTASPNGALLFQRGPEGFRIVGRDSLAAGAIPVSGVNSLGRFSPDGAWLAATSLQAGRSEVYVVSTADPAIRHRVSVDGGEEPRWSADGRRISFRYGSEWFEVSFTPGDPPTIGLPKLVFTGQYENVPGYSYDVFPDGRYLLLLLPTERTTHRLTVVTDVPGLLRDRVGAQR